MEVGIIGAGSWGLALALLLDRNGHQVTLWTKFEEEAKLIQETGEHPHRLPNISIPKALGVTTDLGALAQRNKTLVMAVPSQYVRATSQLLAPFIDNHLVINVAKGLEDETLYTMDQVLSDEMPSAKIAVLSGPSHAEEVALNLPTSVVVAAKDLRLVDQIQDLFMNDSFRVYGSADLMGVELGGALKNVIALAAGISDGLGFGDNAKAALMTRGISEISRLGIAMGAAPNTFKGLTGIGDLIVTCTSPHSRNRKAGILIGQGASLEEALDQVEMVVEGVFSAKAALALAQQYQVNMPITKVINQVLFEGKSAMEGVKDLMERDKKLETP